MLKNGDVEGEIETPRALVELVAAIDGAEDQLDALIADNLG